MVIPDPTPDFAEAYFRLGIFVVLGVGREGGVLEFVSVDEASALEDGDAVVAEGVVDAGGQGDVGDVAGDAEAFSEEFSVLWILC